MNPDNRFQKLEHNEKGRVSALLGALSLVVDLSPGFSVGTMRVLMAVAEEPGLSVSDYAHRLAMTQPTTSMCLKKLGVRADNLGLIDLEFDTQNYARRRVFLTPSGRELTSKVLAELRRIS